MYFSQFPKIYYKFETNGTVNVRPIVDITYNVRFRKEILSNISLYDTYDVKDGETPEILAHRIYGSSLYHWAIMLFNERYNYLKDWPMTTDQLEEYIADNYDDPEALHHYELDDGTIISTPTVSWLPNTAQTQNVTAVTNYQYEVALNDKKRQIKIVDPGLLEQIIKEFRILG